jgi:hypothetical protein
LLLSVATRPPSLIDALPRPPKQTIARKLYATMIWLRRDYNTTGDEGLEELAAIGGIHHVSLHV